MKPGGIRWKLVGVPFLAALSWVTDCSSPDRNFVSGPSDTDAGASNASGLSGVAGQAPSGGGTPSGSGGAGSAGYAGMSVAVAGGAPEGVSGAGAGTGDAGAGAMPLPDGTACQAGTDCASAHRADGVCCDNSCTGCNACSNALTGQNNGVCAPVTSGQDPHAACADETATNQCGNDGTCDGKGACSKVGSSHVCAVASCSSDGKSFTAATTCNRDGSGSCTAAAPQDCAGFPCTATGCAKPCTTNSDCSATNYCAPTTGKCVARKSDGSAAADSYECSSGIVADGVCCNSACTGQCQSCKQTAGACKAVTTARGSCAGSGTCGTMKCDGTHADCVLPGNEVSCPSTCSSDLTAKISSTCNGSGACGAAKSTSCGSQYCKSGGCVNKLANNTAGCTTDTICSSGNCSVSPTASTMCCAAGSSDCSQGCYNLLSDAKHCGNCSTVCGPNNSCSSGSCRCTAGSTLSCGTCPSWDFESNSTEGWVNDTLANNVVSPVSLPTPPGAPFSGTHSLAFAVSHIGPGPLNAGVTVPLCADTTTSTDVTGLSFYLYVDGPAYPVSKYDHALGGYINFLDVTDQFAPKQWIQLSTTSATLPTTATQLGLYFEPSGDWSGTIYVDHVQLTH
jgi:hypothetical protein